MAIPGRVCLYCRARDKNWVTMYVPGPFFCSDEDKVMYLKRRMLKCSRKVCTANITIPIACPCGQHVYCSKSCSWMDNDCAWISKELTHMLGNPNKYQYNDLFTSPLPRIPIISFVFMDDD